VIDATIATYRSSFDSRASTIRWVLTTGLKMFLQLWFSKRPMFWIPESWVPGVVEWGLAFPRAPKGSVSIQVWSFAVGQVVTTLVAAGLWVWAQVAMARKTAVKGPVPVPATEKSTAEKKAE
jgi:hypothetical protein